MKQMIFLFLFLLIFFLGQACSPTESTFDDHELTLSVHADVTEAWVALHLNQPNENANYILKRDEVLVFKGHISSSDTVFYEQNLNPGTVYKYAVYGQLGIDIGGKESAIVATLDTTGHSVTIESYTFGEGLIQSIFNDVAVIDENNIWAVGKIHNADTDRWNEDSTEWLPAYNAIYWDAQNWELKRIYFNYNGGKS